MTAAREIAQGKALVDAALAHGVSHFVYASADQGPDSRAAANYVPQMKSKVAIEDHLKARTTQAAARAEEEEEEASEGGGAPPTIMTWTILRPVAFFDNLIDDFRAHVGFGFLQYAVRPERRMQYVACADIGWFAAQALAHPEAWRVGTIRLAGDEMDWAGFRRVFRETTGRTVPLPYGWAVAPWLVLNVALRELGLLCRWFDENGSGADVAEGRRLYPQVMGLREWLGTTGFVGRG